MCDCYSNVAEAFTIKSMSTAKVFYLQNSDIPGALSPEILDKFRRLQSDQIKWQKSRIESIIQVRQKSAAQFSILRPSKTVKTRTEILAQASMSKSARMEPSKAIAHDAGGSPGDGKLGSTGVRRLAGRTTPLPSLSSYTASRTPKSVASVGGRRGGGTGKKRSKNGGSGASKAEAAAASVRFSTSVRDKIASRASGTFSSASPGPASATSPPSGKLLDPAIHKPQNKWKTKGHKAKIQSTFAILRANEKQNSANRKMPKWHSTSLPFHRRRMEIDVDLGAKNVTGRSNGSVRLICTTSAEDDSKFTSSQRGDPYIKQRQLLDYTRDLVRRARVTETAIAV